MAPRQGDVRDVLPPRTIAACLLLAIALVLTLGSQWSRVCPSAPHVAVGMAEGPGVPPTPPTVRFARSTAGSKLYCGDWQAGYMELHASMLRGERPPRFVVAHGISGLADNLVGAITMFYVALLSDRAFFMDMIEGRRYEWAFDKPNINWTWDDSRAIANSTWNFDLMPYPNTKYNAEPQHIRQGDIGTFGQEYAVLSARTYLGLTVELFDNKHHKAQLFRMGLRPDTAFACAMEFLFEPRQEIKAEHAATIAALQDPATLKIGIQVRTGDSVLFDHDGGRIANFDSYAAYFKCAAQIEETRRLDVNQTVVWYLVSDSTALRKAAAEEYGSKILTAVDAPLGHISQDAGIKDLEGVFRTAAAEVWLTSMVDIGVISQNSGFGRIAAFWSGQWHHTYSVLQNHRDPAKPPAEPRECGPRDYDSLEFLAIDNVGNDGPGV